MASQPYYFGRRPDPPQCPGNFSGFKVECFKCGALNVNVVGGFGEDDSGFRVFLVCKRCGNREELKVN